MGFAWAISPVHHPLHPGVRGPFKRVELRHRASWRWCKPPEAVQSPEAVRTYALYTYSGMRCIWCIIFFPWAMLFGGGRSLGLNFRLQIRNVNLSLNKIMFPSNDP